MKRTISLILLLLMLFQLSACAWGGKPAPTAEPQITAAPDATREPSSTPEPPCVWTEHRVEDFNNHFRSFPGGEERQ